MSSTQSRLLVASTIIAGENNNRVFRLARFFHSIEHATDAVIELLLRLRWWDWDDGLIRQHFAVLSSQPDVGRLRELVAELRA